MSTKMANNYLTTCLIEVAPEDFWQRLKNSAHNNRDESDASNCSGILISSHHGYILTHGSVLLNYFTKNKDVLERLTKNGHLPSRTFQGLQAMVTLERQMRHAQEIDTITEKKSLKTHGKSLFSLTSSNKVDKRTEQLMGRIELVWKSQRFSKTVQSFLPENDAWSFFEDPEKNSNSDKQNSESRDDIDPKLVATLLPYFVLIKINNWKNTQESSKLQICSAGSLHIGDSVHMVGTPFGSMSPSVFMNSASQGIVCNLAGKHQELIVTDARCIPGTEGGPLYYHDYGTATNRHGVAGIVVSALCWKANEWIGLSLACNISEVLESLGKVMRYPEVTNSIEFVNPTKSVRTKFSSSIGPYTLPVVLVKCAGSWGSGVIIDQSQGIVLTCGHVISGNNKVVTVRIDQPSIQWYDADIVYGTPIGNAFDIGVIRLKGYSPCDVWPDRLAVDAVQQGVECFVVGHALFGHHHNLAPSVTSGVISKVVTAHSAPVMLQSTCTVNAGASGGPLVSSEGKLLGIVACNAKDTVTKASYPNINLIVPAVTIWPVLEKYLNTLDPSVLKVLHVKNREITALWKLIESSPRVFPEIASKL